MENPLESLKIISDSTIKMIQLNTLRIIKLEYEMLTLKQMVFKDLAEKLNGTTSEVDSIHESYTHKALLAHLEKFRDSLGLLTDEEIKNHLGI